MCEYCISGWETLCKSSKQTGLNVNGCFSEYIVAKASHVVPIPKNVESAQASPIMCAGLTSYKGIKESEVKAGEFLTILGGCAF